MGCKTSSGPSLSLSCLPVMIIVSCFLAVKCNCGEVKGMFVFGSSVVDNGNNNFLKISKAKANYLPYGIDFPNGPSGRFTNGKTVIDFFSHQLGLPLVPPFADPSTKPNKTIHGVNFASAASGILDDTGLLAGEVISLSKQMKNFEEITLRELEGEMGRKREEILKDYLFVVGTGGNDYSFNYFLMPSYQNVTLQTFTINLTNSLSAQLQRLYKLGGRKFALMSVNPIGCYPMVKATRRTTGNSCIQPLNRAAQLFNFHLKSLVDNIRPLMPTSDLVFVNSYKILRDLIANPASQGFKDASNPCCEVATISEGGNGSLCRKDGKVCEDRKTHVFFDGLHPTEAVNVLVATKAFNSNLKTEAYPINIKQLTMYN